MKQEQRNNVNDRDRFMALLKRHVEQSTNTGTALGVLLVDIDRFRKVNWAFGYKAGDAVLEGVANVLAKVARKRDLIARLGGNQFAMVLPGLMNVGHAVLAATKLLRLLEVPIQLHDREIKVSATIGLAVSPFHGKHEDVLLLNAEKAMHRARDNDELYAIPVSAEREKRAQDMDIEFGLQSAVAAGEMELYYQPKLHIRRMRPVGAEALIRWNSPVRGRVGPNEFISIAEQSGTIMGLTQWAINTALREVKEWPQRWGTAAVAVNVSACALNDPSLVDIVQSSIGLWEAAAGSLILEITESSAMANPDHVFDVFREIKQTGTKVSLDDFGTGYSSLAYFRDIPADELKLDKSFVSGMVNSAADRQIAKLVIDLAHAFNLRVVAEGVENAATYKLLAQLGCDYAQGFFIAKPMPQRAYCAWLAAYQGLSTNGPRLVRKAA